MSRIASRRFCFLKVITKPSSTSTTPTGLLQRGFASRCCSGANSSRTTRRICTYTTTANYSSTSRCCFRESIQDPLLVQKPQRRSLHLVAAAASPTQVTALNSATFSNTHSKMKRSVSSDQVKLFLFGLLRTVSALASTTPTDARFAAAAATASCRPSNSAAAATSSSGHAMLTDLSVPCTFTLRLARRTDVPSIQRCNLATLPENYNQQFYANHLRQWPELAFVAVETPINESPARSSSSSSSLLFSSCFPGQVEEKVVAYVLGKVEERTVLITDENDLTEADWEEWTDSASSRRNDNDRRASNLMIRPPAFTTERLGHVTSLAVLEPYRRRGLALELMKQLHYHLRVQYRVPAVGLHVRQSNAAAEKLYRQFGYVCDERIEGYYQDGEDAYFMKKVLPPIESTVSTASGAGSGGGGIFDSLRRQHRPWETGPMHLRLPRMVGMPPPIEPISSSSSTASSVISKEEEEETPELLTGTM